MTSIIEDHYIIFTHGRNTRILNFIIYNKTIKICSEKIELNLLLNLAQSYKWLGNHKECAEILKNIDWSAKDIIFRLAEAVLSEKWDQSLELMKLLGNDKVWRTNYREWPIFQEFIKRSEFLNTYKEIFENDFEEEKKASNMEITKILKQSLSHKMKNTIANQ